MLVNPTVSTTLMALLLVVALYLAAWPQRSSSGTAAQDDDTLANGQDGPTADRFGKNNLGESEELRTRRGLCL